MNQPKETSAFATTDPAAELAATLHAIIGIDHRGQETTSSAFRRVLFKGIAIADYLDLISILHRRLVDLRLFTDSTRDGSLDLGHRRKVTEALVKFAEMLDPNAQGAPWHQIKEKGPKQADVTALEFFSIVVRRHKTLRALSPDERQKVITTIDDVLLKGDFKELPEWAALPLIDGLKRLRLVTEHLAYFGSETAVDALIDFFREVQDVESRLQEQGDKPAAARNKIIDFLTVIAIMVDLYCAAAHVIKATHEYKELYRGWNLRQIQNYPSLPAPSTLLIAPPGALRPDEPSVSDESGREKPAEPAQQE